MDTSFVRRPRQSWSRALAKTLCYRLLMVAITIVVAWAIVGDVSEAASIGLVANVVKTGTYYGYERLWDRVAWGLESA
ncbi:Uncharacterized membrane protein [Haloplanus vescus]|uniref:Uncharacterized membrane protein n=1 Tax=Haloplanus vescus TaxID=555874 RepID=A0A1H3X822_9EURY|nr:DUF2061 domain-containing protein [Haloplanus vescus]SDZ95370.1 Uncharacterized membrane protein [Haloplanus vescus]